MSRMRVGVLASGGGSNLQALLDHLTDIGDARACDVVLVASNRPDAGALERAASAGIATAVLESPHAPAGADLAGALRDHEIELVALAGYMRHVPADVTRRYHHRMVNVHPALLPAFGGPGMFGARVHRAVVGAQASESGPTVHFVDDIYDHGATIAQWPVPVYREDDEHTLASRVLRAEHLLYPRIIQALAAVAMRSAEAASLDSAPLLAPRIPMMDPALDDRELAVALDAVLDRAFAPASRD